MIYLIAAPPGNGKTYFATYLALKTALKDYNKKPKGVPKRDVYTNYPVIDKKTGYSTLKWEPYYTKKSILDADIILDEAWMYFSSRDYKNFGKDLQAFFAMNRHNDLDIYIIAQNPARVDVIIREMVNEFYYVEKHSLPFKETPFFFTIWVYQDLNQMAKMSPDPMAYISKKRILFKKRIAEAYNTHQFRTAKETEIKPVAWIDDLEKQGVPRVLTPKEQKAKVKEDKKKLKEQKRLQKTDINKIKGTKDEPAGHFEIHLTITLQ